MVETVTGSSGGDGFAAAAQLLHDFNEEYGESAPPPDELSARLADLVSGDHVTVLLARERGADYAFLVTSEDDRSCRPPDVAPSQVASGSGSSTITAVPRSSAESMRSVAPTSAHRSAMVVSP